MWHLLEKFLVFAKSPSRNTLIEVFCSPHPSWNVPPVHSISLILSLCRSKFVLLQIITGGFQFSALRQHQNPEVFIPIKDR